MAEESKTPRTDAAVWLAVDVNDGQVVMADFARNLERENAVLRGRVAELETEMENFDHAKSYIVDLEAKIVELEAARVDPKTHAIVPRYPTQEMCDAFMSGVTQGECYDTGYVAMLNAAPEHLGYTAAMAKDGA